MTDLERLRDYEARIRQVLGQHWLTSIECFHVIRGDKVHCVCGWTSEPKPSLGAAVADWEKHVQGLLPIAAVAA